MMRLCLFTWVALLLHACQTTPVKNDKGNLKNTLKYAYLIKDTGQWVITKNHNNAVTALNVLKAYELGDTARLRSYLADTVAVYYDGGKYKGGSRELMYAIKEKIKSLTNLRIQVNNCETAINKLEHQERVITRYTQFYTNERSQADSADLIDEAFFENNKIVVWRSYVRRYANQRPSPGEGEIK
ncbi:hypothetical protein ACFQ3S_18275 [Mucilaginibacter terrae]|uniref:hypothetical protein n=1 Tax=Mucilaginibacter terrae TaxID=1955052 RepID=UPI00362D0D46